MKKAEQVRLRFYQMVLNKRISNQILGYFQKEHNIKTLSELQSYLDRTRSKNGYSICIEENLDRAMGGDGRVICFYPYRSMHLLRYNIKVLVLDTKFGEEKEEDPVDPVLYKEFGNIIDEVLYMFNKDGCVKRLSNKAMSSINTELCRRGVALSTSTADVVENFVSTAVDEGITEAASIRLPFGTVYSTDRGWMFVTDETKKHKVVEEISDKDLENYISHCFVTHQVLPFSILEAEKDRRFKKHKGIIDEAVEEFKEKLNKKAGVEVVVKYR